MAGSVAPEKIDKAVKAEGDAPEKAAEGGGGGDEGKQPKVLRPNPLPKVRTFRALWKAYWQNSFAQEVTFFVVFTVIFSVGACGC